MRRDEAGAPLSRIVALIAIGLLTCLQADARPVRAGARESIQAFGAQDMSVHSDIDLDVDQDWDASPSPVAAASPAPRPAGSIVYALPGPCVAGGRLGATYYDCSGVWYEPRFAGASITYVVANPPRQIASLVVFENVAPRVRRER
jgi:hypothetical protein